MAVEGKHAKLLVELGFEQLSRLGEEYGRTMVWNSGGKKPISDLTVSDSVAVGGLRAHLATARARSLQHLESSIYVTCGGVVQLTLVLDEGHRIWLINEFVDLHSYHPDFIDVAEMTF